MLDADATTAGSDYVYTRNADYWDADAYPYDKVEIKFLDDTTARSTGCGRAEHSAVGGVSTADVVSGAKSAGLNVATVLQRHDRGLYLWDRDGALAPALGDVRVRQAINYAMDRETIVETVKGGLGTADRADLRARAAPATTSRSRAPTPTTWTRPSS